MLTIAICDDDVTIFDQLKEFIAIYCFQKNRDYKIHYYATADELINAPSDYNLLFLDIMLDSGNDGIEIGKQLRIAGNTALFILVTSRTDRTLDGYEATVFRYLIKPVQQEELFNVLDAAINTMDYDRDIIAVKFKYQTSYVHIKDIIYVESYLRKRHVITKEQQYQTTASWPALMKQFAPYPHFFIPRKTHLINLAHVIGQSDVGVTLSNGKHIKFASGKYELFLPAYSRFLNREV